MHFQHQHQATNNSIMMQHQTCNLTARWKLLTRLPRYIGVALHRAGECRFPQYVSSTDDRTWLTFSPFLSFLFPVQHYSLDIMCDLSSTYVLLLHPLSIFHIIILWRTTGSTPQHPSHHVTQTSSSAFRYRQLRRKVETNQTANIRGVRVGRSSRK